MWFQLAILLCLPMVFAAKGPNGVVVKADLPFISCDVCERTVERIFQEVSKARKDKPIDELKITEIIESVTSSDNEAGEWMRHIDIIETTSKGKRYLSLVEPGGTAKCKNECATIAKSVQNLINEEIDVDELSALLWKNKLSSKEVQVRVV
jgi:hypothetical protein